MKRLLRDSRLLTSILASPKTAVLAVFVLLLNAAAVFTNSRGDVHSSAPADSSVATKNVLAYIEYADTSSSGEYQNTLSAINSVSSNYVVTQLTDYTQLATALPGNDVLLIPEQENSSSSQLQSIGTAWATTLQNFVNNGGVVIQCDYVNRYHIITGSGLMSITSSAPFYDQTVTVVAPGDPVAQGMPASYYGRNGSVAYTTSETRVVVERSGYGPVVINKEMGLGNVVLIGHDYYESNASQDRIVGNAVFNLPSIRDDLIVTPWNELSSSGAEGGPFSPLSIDYTLTNSGSATLDWTASKSAAWVDLSLSAGTLAPSESVTVTVSINANANSLAHGTYTDTVTFTNTTSGVSRYREVTLNVYQVATLPFFDDFESGVLASYWHSTGTYDYRTEVTSDYVPYSGSYHLIMDNGLDNDVYSRNELTLIIDLDGYENAVLSFWMKEFNDEDEGPPPTPFIDGADFDGVAVSEDGITWYEIQGLRTAQGVSDVYSQFIVDLDAATATYGLSYNSAFCIRFNHYDDYAIPTDGFAFDYISLTADIRDDLVIEPRDDYRVSGAEGGPFSPASKTYMLTNRGAASLDWTASKTAPWIDLSPSAGTLAPSGSVAVTVSINANANSLTHGTYTDTLTFTNTTSGVSRYRDVTLEVFQVATLPFFDGFESGTLASYWSSTGTNEYRTEVTSDYYPNSGSYHLIMDDGLDNDIYSRNELTLRINLQGYNNVTLAFWMKEFDDEDEGPPPAPFIGGADFDGVAVSEDGITWYEIQGLRSAQGVSAAYSQFIVDLDAAIATYGLSYNSAFRIRFNHYDNFSMESDGFAFDDISITRAVARYDFETGDEGWVCAGQVIPYEMPTTTSLDGHIGLNALGSANCFSYLQSPDIPIEDGRLYRARWTVQCDVSDPDDAVQFRLRVNQAGTWSAWNRVINSYLGHAPSAGNPKDYDVYFKPVVTGAGDNHAVFCFDIMSFAPYDDTNCWLYLEELRVDEVAASLDREILRYDFTYGGEGWIFEDLIWPFDRPQAIILPGRIGISPNGSANSFSYWWSPDVLLENNKIYRVRWDVESDVANPDDAVQFRVRANQIGAWSAWNRNVNSYLQASPSASNPKRYDIFLDPVVTGAYDDQMVLFFDITSFDPTDDVTSWLYLDSVRVEEISVGP